MKSFEKIIGYEKEKMELIRLCDTMKNKQKYIDLGIELPQTLLICGEPGLGKTLMAKALIEESGRNCFPCKKDKPDGEFVSTITNVFEQAREKQPSIIFLDDMDKFAEDNLNINSNKEEFVTIQTCLEKIKGEDIFVVATANNINNLPESLLRAGRFGRQIKVEAPNKKDSVKIISYYLKNKKVASDVDAETIANILVKKSCAVLENVINEAGIVAAFSGHNEIKIEHITDAILRVVLKTIENERENPENEKIVAYHETGHAVMSILCGSEVGIITIKKFGDTGGVCRRYGYSKTYEGIKEFKNEIMILLAGKSSVEIQYNEPDLGVESDMEKAKDEIRYALEKLCLFGFEYIYDSDDFSRKQSPDRLKLIIEKMTEIITDWYEECKQILLENKDLLDKLANLLLEKKTLIWNDIKKLL